MKSFKGVPRVSMESAVEQALRQAVDDDTFRKVKRVSYSPLAAEEVLIEITSKLYILSILIRLTTFRQLLNWD